MSAATLTERTLIELAAAGSIRLLRVVESGNGQWALVANIGLNERTLGSKREAVRLWASLDTVYRYCHDRLGVNRIQIEGQ